MRSNVVSLLAATALLAFVGSANAKDPVELTDVQLDKITAGDTQTSANVAANVLAATVNVNVAANNLAKAAVNYLVAVNTAAAVYTTAALTSPITP